MKQFQVALEEIIHRLDWMTKKADLNVPRKPTTSRAVAQMRSSGPTFVGASIGALLEPKTSQLDSRDWMLVLGAAGLILGLAAVSRGGN